MMWTRFFGQVAGISANSIVQTTDGGFAIAGSDALTGSNIYLVKTDTSGLTACKSVSNMLHYLTSIGYASHPIQVASLSSSVSNITIASASGGVVVDICPLLISINEHSENENIFFVYPNPSNGNTTLEFSLNEPTFTTVEIFNLLGGKVLTVHEGNLPSGKHKIVFDAGKLQSGVYFVKIFIGERTAIKKVVKF